MAHKHKRALSDSAVPPSRKIARTTNEDKPLDSTPACPGVVKKRDDLPLSKLPSAGEAFSAFAKARADKELADEEAFFELISTYDVPLSLLSAVFSKSYILFLRSCHSTPLILWIQPRNSLAHFRT